MFGSIILVWYPVVHASIEDKTIIHEKDLDDDYSRFTRVYLLRNKDEVFDMFLSYKVEVENHLDRKIKRIRYDKEDEYIHLNDY